MALQRLARVFIYLAAATLTLACDPAYGYYARNDSERDLFVEMVGVTVRLPGGSAGLVSGGIGEPSDVVARVLDANCQLIAEIPLATSHELIGITPDGLVEATRLDPSGDARRPGGDLVETDECIGRVTGAEPLPSGYGVPSAQIAFTSMGGGPWDLWLVHADGSALRNLTEREPLRVFQAGFAPEGRAAAVTVLAGSAQTDIYSMEVPDGELTLLREDAFAPAWSPDGSQLAFRDGQRDEEGPVILLDVVDGLERVLADEGGAPVWSPDAASIAYVLSEGTLESEVRLVDISSGRSRLISAGGAFEPAFSPDAKHLAFTTYQRDETGLISVADLETLATHSLTADFGEAAEADWSPDGEWIAYRGSRGGFGDPSTIWVVRPDGTDARQLTDVGFDFAPAWSRDGEWLLYLRVAEADTEEGYELRLVRADGSEDRLIAAGATTAAWFPQ